jgi:hypothetical protein
MGPLPPGAAVLLPGARFVMGLDVRRFEASPFREKVGKGVRPDALSELQVKAGLDPEHDVDHVFVAGGAPGDRRGVALVVGRFDRKRIAHAIESEKKDVTARAHDGTTVYVFGEASASPGALALLDDHTIVLGTPSAVDAVVARRHATAADDGNPVIVGLLQRVPPGRTFWMVGDQDLLAHLPKAIRPPAASGGGAPLSLPALRSLIVEGDLDPQLDLILTGETADPASARGLADLVRGFLSLASLQAAKRPELGRLAAAINVTTEESRVRVVGRIPYEILEALKGPAPSPSPRAD